ncbi:hypothetical protein QCA50_020434 [Cerrena zonata]|uniref:DUF6589 domain-containing protein n=1 Tax=Cerrena zonata TaxID=2478898 RepID=A0AAW0F7S5_9APHY
MGTCSSGSLSGPQEEKKAIRRKKGLKARKLTQAESKAKRDQVNQEAKKKRDCEREDALLHSQFIIATKEAAQKAHSRSEPAEVFEKILVELKDHGLGWGDLVLYVSGTRVDQKKERYLGFFARGDLVRRILDLWVSSHNSPTGRQLVHDWALSYIGKCVSQEGETVKKNVLLQSQKHPITQEFAQDFDLRSIYTSIKSLCPTVSAILSAFSTTTRQMKTLIPVSVMRNNNRIGSALLILLGDRSQRNSYVKHVMGLYLYAVSASRQLTEQQAPKDSDNTGHSSEGEDDPDWIPDTSDSDGESSKWESSSGNSESESESPSDSEVERNSRVEGVQVGSINKEGSGRGSGLLKRLSLARTSLIGSVYDNANLTYKVAEQILGRKDSMESGTCASIFPLFEATEDKMKTSDLLASLDKAPLLSVKNILLSNEENVFLEKCLEHAALHAIVTYGGEEFARFRDSVHGLTPHSEDKITLHKTDIRPLPAMTVDVSSITGNAEVHDEIFTEVGYDVTSAIFARVVRIIFGDQLSVSRMRTVSANRVGHDDPQRSFLNLALGPGLFHYQIHVAGGPPETHWGNPRLGARDPGSLSFHNTLLDRKPIVLSSAPPYRISHDLIFVSLYGRLIHCLELVAGCSSLDDYARTTNLDTLRTHCKQIIDKFANLKICADLRLARARQHRTEDSVASDVIGSVPSTGHRVGDMVFENAILFLRDAFLLREFTDAIKSGDSGRVRIMLKVLALGYRGMGRTKYAYETLNLLHNLTYIWPTPLRNIMMKNWLLNPTGRHNAWVPVDLVQEHFIFWTKVIYSAQGSNASWEWLANITPCINTLRQLATQLNSTLGSKQGTKHHTPGLENDVREIVKSLRTHRVYQRELGRTIESDSAVIPNILVSGLNQLAIPLRAYNTTFERFRARLRVRPLIGNPPLANPTSNSDQDFVNNARANGQGISHMSEDGKVYAKESNEVGELERASDSESEIDDDVLDTDLWDAHIDFSFETLDDVDLDM